MWLTSPSLREARIGAQGRSPEAGTEAGTTEAHGILTSSACFLRQCRPTYPGAAARGGPTHISH